MWVGHPGSGQIFIDGDFGVYGAYNVLVGSGANAMSGQNVLVLVESPTRPSSLGGVSAQATLFVESGHLKIMSNSGSVAVVASLS